MSPAQKYYGRKSPIGRDVCRLRKAYYNARHEAAAQIDEIVGETASEADSSETSMCEKESGHEKDEDVIRCICGLYKDEGLMIQCDKCMVRAGCALLSLTRRGCVLAEDEKRLLTCSPCTWPCSVKKQGPDQCLDSLLYSSLVLLGQRNPNLLEQRWAP